jgi:hypothetical protein
MKGKLYGKYLAQYLKMVFGGGEKTLKYYAV